MAIEHSFITITPKKSTIPRRFNLNSTDLCKNTLLNQWRSKLIQKETDLCKKLCYLASAGVGAIACSNFDALRDMMMSFFETVEAAWHGFGLTKKQYAYRLISRIKDSDCLVWLSYWKFLPSPQDITDQQWNSVMLQCVFDSAHYFEKDKYEIMQLVAHIVDRDEAVVGRNVITCDLSPALYLLHRYGSSAWMFGVLIFLLSYADQDNIFNILYAQDDSGKMLFHYVAVCCDDILADAIFDKLEPLLSRCFKNKNMLFNLKDRIDFTPLHYACSYANFAMARWLINKGADVQALGYGNVQPIHCVVTGMCKEHDKQEISIMFPDPLLNKADKNWYQHQIEQRKQIIDLLVNNGINLDAPDNNQKTAFDYAFLCGHRGLATYMLTRQSKNH